MFNILRIICLILLTGLHVAQAQETITLRVHHFLPTTSTTHAGLLVPWAEALEADSDGRIQVEIYPSMQLGGKPPQLYDQARDGVVDAVWTVLGYNAGRFPISEVFELPFVAGDAEATSQAAHEFAQRHLRRELRGVEPLLVHTHAPGTFHLAGHRVTRMEDLEGLKIRTPSRTATESLKALGAQPVGMPVPEVSQALSMGVVDGAVLPWEVARPLRI
ncbi:MAG: TRAP transporter substrate-binding protein, partial [Candidatus Competibacteraceae bacterium]|nr:TRAP transporter substrate-binding protein [Candidatus Competibacteraceae bacterium]